MAAEMDYMVRNRLESCSSNQRSIIRTMGPAIRILMVAMLLALTAGRVAAADEAELWQALRDKHAFAIMRHAIAPGFGDPAEFTIGDCATQRNLSEEGRAQARTAGDMFRDNGISEASVYSSQWCRCMETARFLGLGPVSALESLNSFFQNRETGAPQTRALRAWLAKQQSDKPLVLVTHQVNISALTNMGTRSGEIVVVGRQPDGALTVLGSIIP